MAVDGIAKENLNITAYNVCQKEWSVDNMVEAHYLEEFVENNCYLRHARSDGGLWFSFHPDGGSAVYFGPRCSLPIFATDRRAKTSAEICGTTRAAASLSLMEAIVFQRTYLRSLDQQTSELIMAAKKLSTTAAAEELQDIHLRMLKFKAKFTTEPVSSSSAVKEQFALWCNVVGIGRTIETLSGGIADLRGFVSEQTARAGQQRLDTLSVVLGFLGIASLVIDVYVNYITNPDDNGNRRPNLWIMPTVVILLLFLVGFIFVAYTRK